MAYLDGSRLRVERVEHQLAQIDAEETDYYATRPFDLEIEKDADGWRIARHRYLKPIPRMWGAAVGEMLYHLRAALNEAITDLVVANGKRPKGTGFPIYITKDGRHGYFTPRGNGNGSPRNAYLKGLTEQQKAAIDALQPFDRPDDPLARLNSIRNLDEHTRLHVGFAWAAQRNGVIEPSNPEAVRELEIQMRPGEVLEDGTELFRAHVVPDMTMNVHSRIGYHPVFGEQRMTLGEIAIIKERVSEIIEVIRRLLPAA